MSEAAGNKYPKEVADLVQKITSNGGTPLVVSQDDFIIGVIELQDIIKPGIQERFERLRKMGVKTVMVTGDNPLTANISLKSRCRRLYRRSQTGRQDELYP